MLLARHHPEVVESFINVEGNFTVEGRILDRQARGHEHCHKSTTCCKAIAMTWLAG